MASRSLVSLRCSAVIPQHHVTVNELSDFCLLKLVCAEQHIWAKDHLTETQVNCFAKHPQIAKVRLGFLVQKAISQLFPHPACYQ